MDDARHGTSSDIDPLVHQALQESQRLGFIGRRSVDDAIVHARYFVSALDHSVTAPGGSVLDLGAGGGLPGLVIGHDLPQSRLTLLDRRATRTDFLLRVVRRFRWDGRVDVVTQDAAHPPAVRRSSFDAVVARGFGPPVTTLRIAAAWVRSGGVVVISEPPSGDRWSVLDVSAAEVDRIDSDSHVAVFVKR